MSKMHCPACKKVHDFEYNCAKDLEAEEQHRRLVDMYLSQNADTDGVGHVPKDHVAELMSRPLVVVTGDPHLLIIGSNVRIDDFVKIEIGEGVVIGDDTHIASFAHLNIGGGFLYIGDRVGIASGSRIVTGGNDVEAQSMTVTAPAEMQRTYRSSVWIGDDSAVLVNAVVLPGSVIGQRARLASGAVLTGKPIKDDQLWAGAPARFLRWRAM